MKYVDFMHASNHYNLTAQECGFFIHPQEGWLGASPDGVVFDPSCSPSEGLLEIKCPYSVRDVTAEEACHDSSFFCFIDEDGTYKLKKKTCILSPSSTAAICVFRQVSLV